MSDDNGAPNKVGAWTLEAKFEFLLHIIAVINDGKGLPWSQINVPGRTTKSLQNMWTKINKDLAEIRASKRDGQTPVKEPTPRKGGSKKPTEDDDTPTKTPKKRAAAGSKTPSKKVKKEKVKQEVKSETESDGDENVKTEKVDI